MEEIKRHGNKVRKALGVAFVLVAIVSPFFYHMVSFLLLPLLIPLVIIFFFVFLTGLTDFEQKHIIILNIILSVLAIALYEGYLFLFAIPDGHADTHINITIWLVQLIGLNFFLILYWSIKSLRRHHQVSSYA